MFGPARSQDDMGTSQQVQDYRLHSGSLVKMRQGGPGPSRATSSTSYGRSHTDTYCLPALD